MEQMKIQDYIKTYPKGFGLKLAKLRLKTLLKNQAKFRKGEPSKFGWITKERNGL